MIFCDNSNLKVLGGWTHYAGFSGIAEWNLHLLNSEPLFMKKYGAYVGGLQMKWGEDKIMKPYQVLNEEPKKEFILHTPN
ncbi:MAG: hypothetical protein ACTSWN_04265 [Promethearchaeota archaeon]